jgi:trehalose 6-phosphate phosphatase
MLPDALDLVPQLRSARAAAGRLLVGLDFDGTLAPIVPRPADAALPAVTRPILEDLAARADTVVALISGRGLADLRSRVAIDGIHYAGNHGLEIEGPGTHRIHEEARATRDLLTDVARRIEADTRGIDGAIVENKGLTLSVHYRMVSPGEEERVRAAAHAAVQGIAGVRASDGRKVVEIRPDVDWHKGRALRFLRDALLGEGSPAPVIFVGDDRTDEDAFRELGDAGFGIVVGDPPPPWTAARAALASTHQVVEFVRALAHDGPSA